MLPPDAVVRLLEQYGYLALFVGVVVEGPIVTIVGAFVASLGYLDIYAVYGIVVAADLFGDLLYYGIGRLGQMGPSAGVRRLLGITNERLARSARYIERHGAKILLFAKYTQTGFFALPASGAARMPVGRFLWYNALGTIPKSLALVLVGYFFGYAYNCIDDYFMKASLIVFVTLCAAGMYLLLRRRLRTSYDER